MSNYYVRKIAKRQSLDYFNPKLNVSNQNADGITTEFRTSNGTLSVWKIDNLNDIDDAILAIAITSSKIDRMDFIVIEEDLLKSLGIDFSQTYAGQQLAIKELQDTHFDLVNISYLQLEKCAILYQKIIEKDDEQGIYIFRKTRQYIKSLIEKAKNDGKLDINLINFDM